MKRIEEFDFLITGFPRSGTAWLSSLFTVKGNCSCLHEPNLWPQWEKNQDLILDDALREPTAGVVDLGAPAGSLEWGYDKPVLVVVSPIQKFANTVMKTTGQTMEEVERMVEVYNEKLYDWIQGRLAQIVKTEDLFKIDTIRRMVDFIGCEPLPSPHIWKHQNLNIQTQINQIK